MMDVITSLFSSIEAADWRAFLGNGAKIALILALAVFMRSIAQRLIRGFRDAAQRRAHDVGRSRRVETLARTFGYVTTVIIGIVAGSLILGELGISVAPILAAAGVAGIAVGFAAQSLIKDYFNGFFLLLEDQIRQDEVVSIAGLGGVVELITLRYVRLRDFEGHVHFVPNGAIGAVTNRTRDFAQSLIEVGVAYREDVDEALAVMHEVGEAMRADAAFGPRILAETEIIGVQRWDDSAVTICCRLKVVPMEQWGVRREFLKRLKKAYDARGIEIPFPHLTLYPGELKDGTAPPLHVATQTS